MRIALAATLLILAGPAYSLASAASRDDPKTMVELYKQANEQCRGGPGDEKATTDACDEREAYSRRLTQLGWCFGGPQGWWRKCKR